MIAQGTIAIPEGTLLPELLHLNGDSFSAGWTSLGDNFGRKQLEAAVAAAGWTLFLLADAIPRGKAFGFDKAKTIRAAAKRLFAGARLRGANCVEIEEIASGSFFGIPWMTVGGRANQIQSGTSPFMRSVEQKRKMR